jgi:CTP synthase
LTHRRRGKVRICVTTSDFSGLGKGTFSAALGRLLASRGLNVRIMKCDLYYNYDAGTMNPGEHGEVYVLADGRETDQDLGIYERFLDKELTSREYVTNGQIHHQIYLNEREGKYLGQTVSVEHVIDEIKRRIVEVASEVDVLIVELGATIGDIKGTFYLEAIRELQSEPGVKMMLFHLSFLPMLDKVGELKTMGSQRSVGYLRSYGLKPDVLVCRTQEVEVIPEAQVYRLTKFCDVQDNCIICLPDLDDVFELPRKLSTFRLDEVVSEKMSIPLRASTTDDWYKKFSPPNDLSVVLVGKYPHRDAYLSIKHHLWMNGVRDISYTDRLTSAEGIDGVILTPGWGERGVEKMIESARFCRENSVPCLGICLGLQVMVIEYARNVLGLKGANSTEFDESTPHPVIQQLASQKERVGLGGTARLGNWTTLVTEGSKAHSVYKATRIVQRHRHRYEVAGDYEWGKFRPVGYDEKTGLIEIMELADHPFYMGCQFHAEFSLRSPLIEAFVKHCLGSKNEAGYASGLRHQAEEARLRG